MIRAINRWGGVGLAAVALAACGTPSTQCTADCVFAAGEGKDPIVARAKQQALELPPDTVTVTLTNRSGFAWTQGLITLAPIFTVGTVPSTPLYRYVREGQVGVGNAATLAAGLGLAVGTNAFLVPALGNNRSTSLTITVPTTAKITFIARVSGSMDDFVAAVDVPLVSGVPGNVVLPLKGYDLATNNNPNGLTTLGNGTTGLNPPNSTITVRSSTDCPSGSLNTPTNFITDEFNAPANDSTWPMSAGWDGDFNGDWYTDGQTARVWNPNWGGAEAAAPIPTTTGFWKFVSVCPATGSLLQVKANVTTQFTDANTDTTLVVYFFDRAGALLSVSANHPLRGSSTRDFALYDVAIPASTRRIAVAPMMLLAATEQGAAFYDRITVDYELATTYSTTAVATDDFATTQNNTYGNNQPAGWTEFGGDWFTLKPENWATLWNASWAGGTTGVDTGMTKQFSLSGKFVAGDVINAKVFSAATFTDPASFVRVRLVFNTPTGPVIESDRAVRGYGDVQVRRQPIPAGATSVYAIVNAYLGPAEQSSLYVDNFVLNTQHRN